MNFSYLYKSLAPKKLGKFILAASLSCLSACSFSAANQNYMPNQDSTILYVPRAEIERVAALFINYGQALVAQGQYYLNLHINRQDHQSIIPVCPNNPDINQIFPQQNVNSQINNTESCKSSVNPANQNNTQQQTKTTNNTNPEKNERPKLIPYTQKESSFFSLMSSLVNKTNTPLVYPNDPLHPCNYKPSLPAPILCQIEYVNSYNKLIMQSVNSLDATNILAVEYCFKQCNLYNVKDMLSLVNRACINYNLLYPNQQKLYTQLYTPSGEPLKTEKDICAWIINHWDKFFYAAYSLDPNQKPDFGTHDATNVPILTVNNPSVSHSKTDVSKLKKAKSESTAVGFKESADKFNINNIDKVLSLRSVLAEHDALSPANRKELMQKLSKQYNIPLYRYHSLSKGRMDYWLYKAILSIYTRPEGISKDDLYGDLIIAAYKAMFNTSLHGSTTTQLDKDKNQNVSGKTINKNLLPDPLQIDGQINESDGEISLCEKKNFDSLEHDNNCDMFKLYSEIIANNNGDESESSFATNACKIINQ